MKKYRLFLSGLILAMICGMTLYSCQENEITPESEAAFSAKETATGVDAAAEDQDSDERAELVYLAGTDEVMAIYEEGGAEALQEYFLKNYDGNAKVTQEPEQLYCNYKVVDVVAPPQPITGYPGPGKKFCVVCPPFCTFQGFLISTRPVVGRRHYIAYCELNQDGSGCFRCDSPNCIFPRA